MRGLCCYQAMYKRIIVKTEDGHYQAPKHVAVPYVQNTLYSTKKYSFVRRVHTLYISYFIEHDGDDGPHEDNAV